jgi:hypothetical protein
MKRAADDSDHAAEGNKTKRTRESEPHESEQPESEQQEVDESAHAEVAAPRGPTLILIKVISGGQSGADQAGLRAAKSAGLATGGFAARKYMTDDGLKPELGLLYGLKEIGDYSKSYIARTMKNVEMSDGTLAFLILPSPSGTSKTIGYANFKKWVHSTSPANRGFRPVLVLDRGDMESFVKTPATLTRRIVYWLIAHKIQTLNVAGHSNKRLVGHALGFDYGTRCEEILMTVFSTLKE